MCYHKKEKFLSVKNYVPIHVGKRVSNINLDILGDDTGDNISEKNPWYCELTAQYWIWKNCSDVDYVGLCHYRRYLDFTMSFKHRFLPYIHIPIDKISKQIEINERIFNKYDVIMPHKVVERLPLVSLLKMDHISKDIDILKEIVTEKYPDYYNDYEYIMEKQSSCSVCNILYASKEVFDNYSEWLFNILFEFEKRITIPVNPYQPRLFGYYSERLLNLYVYHNKLKVKYLPMIVCDNKPNHSQFLYIFRNNVRKLTCWLFRMVR